LHEEGIFGIIAKRVPDFAHRSVDAMFRINENLARPKPVCDFGACNELTVALKEQDQQFHRLAFKPDGAVIPEEFKPAKVEPVVAEVVHGHLHGTSSAREVIAKYSI
jgi:hypothetical protein